MVHNKTSYLLIPVEDFLFSQEVQLVIKGCGFSPMKCTSLLFRGEHNIPQSVDLTDRELEILQSGQNLKSK